MIEITLTRGKTALIDDADYDLISCFTWCAVTRGRRWYAQTATLRPSTYMHRLLTGASDRSLDVDHIDRNGLNNQRSNLRLCSRSDNNANRPKRPGSSSRYKGVSWSRKSKKWVAQIQKAKKNYLLGFFLDEKDAAIAYDFAALEFYGPYAYLNFPEQK